MIFDEDSLSSGVTDFTVYEKNKKWFIGSGHLYIKKEYQNKGIASSILKSINSVLLKLNVSYMEIEADDMGRYVWSRLEKCEFNTNIQYSIVLKGYNKWKSYNNISDKRIPKLPKDFPKEYLLSEFSPQFIWYVVPIGSLKFGNKK